MPFKRSRLSRVAQFGHLIPDTRQRAVRCFPYPTPDRTGACPPGARALPPLAERAGEALPLPEASRDGRKGSFVVVDVEEAGGEAHLVVAGDAEAERAGGHVEVVADPAPAVAGLEAERRVVAVDRWVGVVGRQELLA